LSRFTRTFTAAPEHIDELGHVNNAVWLQWAQDIATAHWRAVAPPQHQTAFVWVVTRHEIDYRGNIGVGETAFAETFIPDPPQGARFDRCVVFRDGAGKLLVEVRSTWALLDRASGRLQRVRPEIAAPFFAHPSTAATGTGS
jgi:acyl-CoA thioester hydrolase